jgi:hypothetical protein
VIVKVRVDCQVVDVRIDGCMTVGSGAHASPLQRIDERDTRRRITAPPQMHGRFDERDLQRRPHTRLHHMSAERRPVTSSDNDVRVQLRAIVAARDVADE